MNKEDRAKLDSLLSDIKTKFEGWRAVPANQYLDELVATIEAIEAMQRIPNSDYSNPILAERIDSLTKEAIKEAKDFLHYYSPENIIKYNLKQKINPFGFMLAHKPSILRIAKISGVSENAVHSFLYLLFRHEILFDKSKEEKLKEECKDDIDRIEKVISILEKKPRSFKDDHLVMAGIETRLNITRAVLKLCETRLSTRRGPKEKYALIYPIIRQLKSHGLKPQMIEGLCEAVKEVGRRKDEEGDTLEKYQLIDDIMEMASGNYFNQKISREKESKSIKASR